MEQTPEGLARITTADITPEIAEQVAMILNFLEEEADGPPMAMCILTIAMVALNNKYGRASQEEFAEKMKINIINTQVGVARKEKH